MDGSLGYAARLSHREDVGGGLGAREYLDTAGEVLAKSAELACMLAAAERIVVFTGAGVSTSCGIPDFRGPSGVWTLQRKGQPPPKASVRFDQAYPSLTHMVLVGMQRVGRLSLVVSQNVDCLHIRSGLAREALAELHGNCFLEVCESCGAEYVRDFEVPSVGLKRTGRACEGCHGPLRDQCLDWESELPQAEMERAESETAGADVVLCLGTSLQITPACNMPLRATRRGGKLAIVNLQRTPKDSKAALLIRARVDSVMARVASILGIEVPPYVRSDRVRVCVTPLDGGRRFELRLASVHGLDAPLHWLDRCVVFAAAGKPMAADTAPGATAGASDGAAAGSTSGQEGLAAAAGGGAPAAEPALTAVTLSAECGWRAELQSDAFAAPPLAPDGVVGDPGGRIGQDGIWMASAGHNRGIRLALSFELSSLCTLRSACAELAFSLRPAAADAQLPATTAGAGKGTAAAAAEHKGTTGATTGAGKGAAAASGRAGKAAARSRVAGEDERAINPRAAGQAEGAAEERVLEFETVRIQHDPAAVIAAADAEIAAAAAAGRSATESAPQLMRKVAPGRKTARDLTDEAGPREPPEGASRSSARRRHARVD